MNFRILAASVRPRGRVLALLAATALTATLLAPGAQAQTPAPAAGAPKAKAAAPKAAPKAAPAAPAPTAQHVADAAFRVPNFRKRIDRFGDVVHLHSPVPIGG